MGNMASPRTHKLEFLSEVIQSRGDGADDAVLAAHKTEEEG